LVEQRGFVLWIDDDHLLLKYPVEYLEGRGIGCEVCDDFDAALRFIKADEKEEVGRIDLILIDVMMQPSPILDRYGTNDGFESGLRFIDLLTEGGIATGMKKIIYTNCKPDGTVYKSQFKEKLSQQLDTRGTKIVRKGKFKARQFADFIEREIGLKEDE